MSKPSDIFVRNVATSQQRIGYRTPIKFGGAGCRGCPVVRRRGRSRDAGRAAGHGHGSMPLSKRLGLAQPAARGQPHIVRDDRIRGAVCGARKRLSGCRPSVGDHARPGERSRGSGSRRGAADVADGAPARGWRSWWPPAPWRRPSTMPTGGRSRPMRTTCSEPTALTGTWPRT